MMYGHAGSLQASALSRQQSGLTGTHCTACNVNGPLGADVGATAVKGLGDFLSSNNDIDKLYDPIFGILDRLTYSIPAPFDLFAKFGLSFAKQGTDATRSALKTAARAAAKYTKVEVSNKALGHMAKAAPLTFWNWAARDKMAQNADNSGFFKLALEGYNKLASEDNKLNLNVRTRLANNMEWLLIKNGATPQQAAMVAWTIAKSMGTDANTLMGYAKKAGAQTADELLNPELAWQRLYGKQAAAGGEGPAGSESEGGMGALPLLAAGALAFLALR